MIYNYENLKHEMPLTQIIVFSKIFRVNIIWILEGGDEKAKLISEAMDYAVKEARQKVLKISDQHSAYNNEESTLNMVTQYLSENLDLLESVAKIIEGREGLKKFEKGE